MGRWLDLEEIFSRKMEQRNFLTMLKGNSMKPYYFILFVGAMTMAGCAGLKFASSAMEESSAVQLPGDFANRKFLVGLSSYRNEPQLLPGRIFHITSNDSNHIYTADRIP